MIEQEIKILINEEQYRLINNLFHWDIVFSQVNYYYDDITRMDEEDDITVRIRSKKDDLMLQVKIPKEKKASLHVKEEYEKRVIEIQEKVTKEELFELTGKKYDSDRIILGNLETLRKICNTYQGVEICLDHNRYLQMEDYEIEIEFTGDYPESLVSLLKKNGIVTKNEIVGKHSRFIEQYKKQFSISC